MASQNERPQRIWDRPATSRNGPIVGTVISLLAVFGALVVGLTVVGGSVTAAGARIDGWIAAVTSMFT